MTLESWAPGNEAHPVRRGADGKGLREQYLAGGLPYGTFGLRREARYHIPGSAGKHSKEVFGLPAYPRSKGQRDQSMLGEGRDCRKALYGRSGSTRPTW